MVDVIGIISEIQPVTEVTLKTGEKKAKRSFFIYD